MVSTVEKAALMNDFGISVENQLSMYMGLFFWILSSVSFFSTSVFRLIPHFITEAL